MKDPFMPSTEAFVQQFYEQGKKALEEGRYRVYKINNKPNENEQLSPHLEAIHFIQWLFWSERNDSRIPQVFDYVLVPEPGDGWTTFDFEDKDFVKAIMQLKSTKEDANKVIPKSVFGNPDIF